VLVVSEDVFNAAQQTWLSSCRYLDPATDPHSGSSAAPEGGLKTRGASSARPSVGFQDTPHSTVGVVRAPKMRQVEDVLRILLRL